MANAATWRERIEEWRASGLSAAKFAESQGLTAHQVWNWAAKFRREDEPKAMAAAVAVPAVPPAEDVRAKADSIAMAKVVRVPRPEPAAKQVTTLLSVELLGIRIAVPTGFDRPTFAMVLDEIEARRARLGER